MPYYPQTNPPAGPAGIRADVRLEYVSTSIIRLNRCNGTLLVIDNVLRWVPEAGVDLAPTGLTAGTVYYIYACMNASGLMALEASTTGHAADARNGVRVKSGDATRTLVGMARPDTGPIWIVSAQYVYVRSYYNDPGAVFDTVNNTSYTTTSLSPIAVAGCACLIWANEIVGVSYHVSARNSVASAMNSFAVGIDVTTPTNDTTAVGQGAADLRSSINTVISLTMSEGFHVFYLLAWVNTGTMTLDANSANKLDGWAGGVSRSSAGSVVMTSLPMPMPVYADCRLEYVSTTVLRLSRCDGYLFTINNEPQIIPVVGVTLAPTGLGVDTFYYIYAAIVGGVMVLEASATGHTVDVRNGQRVKNGDASRALVGMVRTSTGPSWHVSINYAQVRTYYNDPGVKFYTTAMYGGSTASTSPVAMGGPCSVLVWENEIVSVTLHASLSNTVGGSACYIGISDGSTNSINTETQSTLSATSAGYQHIVSTTYSNTVPEGFHIFYFMAFVGGNTMNLFGASHAKLDGFTVGRGR